MAQAPSRRQPHSPLTADDVQRAFSQAELPSPAIQDYVRRASLLTSDDQEARAVILTAIVAVSANRPSQQDAAIDRMISIMRPGPGLKRLIRDVARDHIPMPEEYLNIARGMVPPHRELAAPLHITGNPMMPGPQVCQALDDDLRHARDDIARTVAGAAAIYSIFYKRSILARDTAWYITCQSTAIATLARTARAAMHRPVHTPDADAMMHMASESQRYLDQHPAHRPGSVPAHIEIPRRASRLANHALNDRYHQAIATPLSQSVHTLATAMACWREIRLNLPRHYPPA